MHDKDGEVSVEDLNRIVEDFTLNSLAFVVLLVILRVNFRMSLGKKCSVILVNEVVGGFVIHREKVMIIFSFIVLIKRELVVEVRQSFPNDEHDGILQY